MYCLLLVYHATEGFLIFSIAISQSSSSGWHITVSLFLMRLIPQAAIYYASNALSDLKPVGALRFYASALTVIWIQSSVRFCCSAMCFFQCVQLLSSPCRGTCANKIEMIMIYIISLLTLE